MIHLPGRNGNLRRAVLVQVGKCIHRIRFSMRIRIKRQLHMIAYINRQTGLMLDCIPDQVFHVVRKNQHLHPSVNTLFRPLKTSSRPDHSSSFCGSGDLYE